MSAVLSARRWAVTVTLAVVAVLAVCASASAATGPPVWGPAVPYGTPVSVGSSGSLAIFLGTSCRTAADCVAVGLDDSIATGGESAVFAIEHNGTWGPTDDVQITGALSSQLQSVSCSSVTSCVAVGIKGTAAGNAPVIIPISISGAAGTAGTPASLTLPANAAGTPIGDPDSVSCTSAGDCTAVGSYTDTGGHTDAMVAIEHGDGTWTATAVTAPKAAANDVELNAVSCPSNGPCEAVGSYADSSGDLFPWAVSLTGVTAGQPEPVTLPSNALPSPATAVLVPGLNFNELGAISCLSAGVCTAAGSFETSGPAVSPVAVPITNGTPGTAVVPAPTALGDETTISGISCSGAGDCSVSGSDLSGEETALTPLVGAETGGSWEPLSPLTVTSGDSIALTTSLSCASAGVCLTTGFEESASNVFTASTFFANSTPPLAATTTSLPAATVGRPYSATLRSSGGSGITSWALTAGTLPDGLSLDGATGVISGIPTMVEKDGFVVTVSSTPPPQNTTASLSITVSPATPTSPPPPSASKVVITHLTTSGAKAKVTLTCSGAACAGALKVTGVEHLIGKTPTAVATSANHKHKKARKRTKTITLAVGHYSLVAGSTKTVTLTLSKVAAKLLTKLHTVHGRLTATPTGTQPPVTMTVTFKAKTSRHNKKHKK